MPNDPTCVEIITGHERRRRYIANEKLALADATMQPGMTVSAVARLHGVSPSLLFKWRQLMSQGGQVAVKADEDVVVASKARDLEQRVRELGKKTMEVEVLKGVLAATGRFPLKVVADTLGVARFHLVKQLSGTPKPRDRYLRQGDGDLLAAIRQLTDARPTYGYRRITALLNRARRASAAEPINHKRVFRLMAQDQLLLQRHVGHRPIRALEDRVIASASNQRWSSDGLEISCWNGDVVRLVFAIDTCNPAIIAWQAGTGGFSGEMVCDLMLACVERRFDSLRAPHPVPWLSDNGSAHAARETIDFATALALVPCFTPVLVRSARASARPS